MLKSIVYISHSLIEPKHAATEIENLVARSIANNARHEITGSLVYTGTHFAQIPEGPDLAVAHLMQSIMEDARHERLAIVFDAPLRTRAFEDWSLAYRGPSLFIARNVERLWRRSSVAEDRRSARWLSDVMKHLAKG